MININEIEAVLFDMDGTLVDTEPMGQETMKNFLSKNKIILSIEDLELFDKVWRRDGTDITTEQFMNNVFNRYLNISITKEQILNFYHDYENDILLAKQLPYASDILLYLKGKYKLALVTASSTSQVGLILKKNNWENIFNVIISHDDFKKSKPDPESFLIAAEKLGISPEKCVVVEDSKNGVLAGKNAGMFVIGVRAGNKHIQDISVADMIIETLGEVKSIL